MTLKKRVLLKIQYDGTCFQGWQRQPNFVTVQQVLEDALSVLTREQNPVLGVSRTDAGVHALDQIARVEVDENISLRKLLEGLNALTGKNICVVDAVHVETHFCPRRANLGKTYEYTIVSGHFPQPSVKKNAWFIKDSLQIEAMQQAGKLFLGHHEFKAFQAKKCRSKNTIKEIMSLSIQPEVEEHQNIYRIHVTGNSFLRHMIRIITGALVDVGRGRLPIENITQAFSSGKRSTLGMTAPPYGLCLKQIHFNPDPFCQKISQPS